ncbi:DUF1836 domain-containing protein [Bacillus testis]|uniref:DUF1836 domain-containing protein n=1 Tax=Bacillus testis TaxID=1622072 RepID=UPI00067ED60D|nr:DUF1836 domain-containing protein [Bacillus testis]
MENKTEYITKSVQEPLLKSEDIPDIDLYMDQVIQLFEQKFGSTKRHEEDKILTKTMINNYAKGKLFFPIKNKKYSKNHLILISLIYQLKGILSINDIKDTLSALNKEVTETNRSLESFYESYLAVQTKNAEHFKEEAALIDIEAAEEMQPKDKELEPILKIASMIHMSQMYKKAAETLIDELKLEADQKG